MIPDRPWSSGLVHDRPWYFATLIVECSTCGAAAGRECHDKDGIREKFHLARYEHARRLAGHPIRRARASATNVATPRGGDDVPNLPDADNDGVDSSQTPPATH